MDIAARRGYEAVITLSNDVALEGSPLVDVRIDGRRKHKVALWHLSWAEVAHQAQMLIRHEGVGNAAHAWLLQELLHYLQHENSGCHGFQNMGAAWVPVRKGIDDETLCQGDPRAMEVVESWERLVRQVCLRLGGELGQKVLPVQRAKRGADPRARRADLADQLCSAAGSTPNSASTARPASWPSPRTCARASSVRRSRSPAPEQGYPLTWAKRLIRQLAEAPADLHVETLRRRAGRRPARHAGTAAPRAGRHPSQGRRRDHRLPPLPLQEHGQHPGHCGVRFHPQRRRGGGPVPRPRGRAPGPPRLNAPLNPDPSSTPAVTTPVGSARPGSVWCGPGGWLRRPPRRRGRGG